MDRKLQRHRADSLRQHGFLVVFKTVILHLLHLLHEMTYYDIMEEFNMDSKAECDQLNLAHVTRNKRV